jgi:accessory Sec system protein Asp3
MDEHYFIKWPSDFTDISVNGSTIKYSGNGTVYFANEMLSPGKRIVKWRSNSRYMESGVAPTLPLLKQENCYTLRTIFSADRTPSLQIQIVFFNIDGGKIKEVSSTEKSYDFNVPKETVSYEINLINLSHHWIKFDHLEIHSENSRVNNNNIDVYFGKHGGGV